MRKKAVLFTGLAAAAVLLGGATVALAAGSQALDRPFQVSGVGPGQDDDSSLPPLSTADRDQAANAALAKVGQGAVREVERENDGAVAYEVEVRLDNGSEVDVGLGADFAVLDQAAPEVDDD